MTIFVKMTSNYRNRLLEKLIVPKLYQYKKAAREKLIVPKTRQKEEKLPFE